MFEEIRLLGSADPNNSIVLQTAIGRPVRNTIALPPGHREREVYRQLRKQFGGNWVQRKPATGRYNCHGMVFASRRTAVYEDEEVARILNDDGFRPLAANEQPMVGDVVLYRDRRDRSLLHAARVTSTEELGGRLVLHGLSKWNDSCGEDIHHVNDVPWPKQGIECDVEFRTDRPPMGATDERAGRFADC